MPHYRGEQWVVARRIKGSPEEDNFKISGEDVPELRKGEILCRALFISIDPISSATPPVCVCDQGGGGGSADYG